MPASPRYLSAPATPLPQPRPPSSRPHPLAPASPAPPGHPRFHPPASLTSSKLETPSPSLFSLLPHTQERSATNPFLASSSLSLAAHQVRQPLIIPTSIDSF